MEQQYIRMSIGELCQLLAFNASLMDELISNPAVNLSLLEETVSFQFDLHERLRKFLVSYEGASGEMIEKYDELLYQMRLQNILFNSKIGLTKTAL